MDSAESTPKKKRVSRWLIGCGGTGVVFAVVITWFILQVADYPLVTPRLDSTVKAYKDAGLPWVASDVVSPLPPEQNAALEIQEAIALSKTDANRAIAKKVSELAKRNDLPAISSEIQLLSPVLDKYVSASKKPKLFFNRDWDKGGEFLFPEYSYMKTACTNLAIRATVRAKMGDLLGSVGDLEAINRLSILVAQDPTLIGMLVGISMNSIGQTGYLRVAEVRGDTPTLRELMNSLNKANIEFDCRFALRGDMYMSIAVARNAKPAHLANVGGCGGHGGPPLIYRKKNGVPDGMIMQANFIRVLEGYMTIFETLGEHPNDLMKALKQLEHHEEKLYTAPAKLSLQLRSLMFPILSGAGIATERVKAQKQMTLATLKCLEFKNAKKRFPKSLSEIGFSYTDRISGKKVVSSDSGGIFQIYTLGQNGIDEGGRRVGNPSDDYAIQFPPKPW